ncbi:MAG: cytochrome P450 [Acidimicrobiales bacterium]
MRWVTPLNQLARTVVADTTVGDQPVAAGDYLVMLYASGNRDEAAFGPTAGAFDVTRVAPSPNLGFGFGEHLCLGAALARLEGRIVLEELLARHPDYELAEEPVMAPSSLVHGPAALSVQWA